MNFKGIVTFTILTLNAQLAQSNMNLGIQDGSKRISTTDFRAFMLDPQIVYIFAAGFQRAPVCHFNGNNRIVFWSDERSDESDIFCARVNQNGVLIDTVGKIVSSAFRYQEFVRICFDGQKYFAVWLDLRNDPGNWRYQIYGARVRYDGTVIDTSGIMITNHQFVGWLDIAFGKKCYLVVWAVGSWPDIYCARVDTSGILIDTNAIVITNAYRNQNYPKVAFDGTNFFVIWQDDRNYPTTCLYGARINEDGVLIDTNGIRITNIQTTAAFPAIMYNGDHYFITWSNYMGGEGLNIYGARMTTDGVLIDTNWIPISLGPGDQILPSIGYDGERYLVVWSDFRNDPNQMLPEVYGIRILRNGTVLDSTEILLSRNSYGYYPSVCYDNENYLVVWGLDDIYGVRVNQQGIVLDSVDVLISKSANNQITPTIAYGSVNGLCAWFDDRRGKSDIYGIRISRVGNIMDTSAIAIDTAGPAWFNKQWLHLAASDTIYLLVWIDSRNSQGGRDLYGIRVNHRGQVLDDTPILISGTTEIQNTPSVCFGDTNFLVVWRDERPGGIYGARVSKTGVVIDLDGFRITTEGGDYPSVLFDGTNFFVVWVGNYQIKGARVTQSGSVIDTIPISITNTFAVRWGYPTIAFDGTSYFVAWAQRESGLTQNWDIYGARVRYDGFLIDTIPIPISVAPDSQVCPAAVFDGSNFFVVWQDFRFKNNDIYGARISQGGIVIDSFIVAGQNGNQSSPALGLMPDGERINVVYSGWCVQSGNRKYNSMRIFSEIYGSIGMYDAREQRVTMPEITVFPNPFTEKVYIRVKNIRPPGFIPSIFIYDISGRLVKELRTNANTSSYLEYIWDRKGGDDKFLSDGIYFMIIKTDRYTYTHKLVVLRKGD